MTSAVLDAARLGIGYPGCRLLITDFSLCLEPGRIVGIKGRSGCGKTSLLRVLAGLMPPRHGSISWAGLPRPRPGGVSMVFQDPFGSLDPRWEIGRAVEEPLTGQRISRAERAARARRALADAGLGSISVTARPTQLSGGQCQRVAIARATIADASLILADEPTSALDASVSAGILRLLRSIADRGTAMVVVSHNPLNLAALCDHVIDLTRYQPLDSRREGQ